MSTLGPSTPKSRYQDKETSSENSSAQWKHPSADLLNEESTSWSTDLPASFHSPNTAAIFKSNTIAPSPPPHATPPNELSDLGLGLEICSRLRPFESHDGNSSPLSAGLRIQTDIIPGYTVTPSTNNNTARTPTESTRIPPPVRTPSLPLSRTPSVKNVLASSVGSISNIGSAPGSAWPSPMLNAMADVTPLPSPLLSGDSPGPWKKLIARPSSRDMMIPMSADSALVTANGESISSAVANQSKRRTYQELVMNASEHNLNGAQTTKEKTTEGHTRNRSISEYVPDVVQVPKPRHTTVSGSHTPMDATPTSSLSGDMHMRREPHLATQRGLAPTNRPPTPPSSRTGRESSDSECSLSTANVIQDESRPEGQFYYAHTRGDLKMRRWRGLDILGEGTFSKVVLATSRISDEDDKDEHNASYRRMSGLATPVPGSQFDDKRKKLVAIKICQQGPKGGGDEARVELSVKRELEMMKTIHHPSLVHLKAWNVEETRVILVLSYCAGGDLFEVASQHRHLLVPSLLRRMFAEMVAAVRYLHERHIVHRDIKLENVLVNLPHHELSRPLDWQKYPYSIITLTDLGLSRRVADDEKLTTRCGSDDYVSPEVWMSQPYDGRATDAWSLGVVLYALLEARLPFDPPPWMSAAQQMRSKTGHRIARIEWCWIEYAGEEGDHEADPKKFKERGLEGAMLVTEGLLRRARNRWTLEKVAEEEWVKGGIAVEGGIKFREEDEPEEVSAGNIDSSLL